MTEYTKYISIWFNKYMLYKRWDIRLIIIGAPVCDWHYLIKIVDPIDDTYGNTAI